MGWVLLDLYTVGCAALGAPSLTIVTCVTVGATIGRPQRDRSLRRERPRIRVTITWEANGLPYGINVAYEFTDGGVRAPALRYSFHPHVHFPFSILHFPLFRKKEQRPALSKRNAVISLHFYQICEVNTL